MSWLNKLFLSNSSSSTELKVKLIQPTLFILHGTRKKCSPGNETKAKTNTVCHLLSFGSLTRPKKCWQLVEHGSQYFHSRYIVFDCHQKPTLAEKSPLQARVNIFVRHCWVNIDKKNIWKSGVSAWPKQISVIKAAVRPWVIFLHARHSGHGSFWMI